MEVSFDAVAGMGCILEVSGRAVGGMRTYAGNDGSAPLFA